MTRHVKFHDKYTINYNESNESMTHEYLQT